VYYCASVQSSPQVQGSLCLEWAGVRVALAAWPRWRPHSSSLWSSQRPLLLSPS
jgi:hypothetical protein